MRKKGSLNDLTPQNAIGKRVRTAYIGMANKQSVTAIIVDKNRFDEFSKKLIDIPWESSVVFGAYVDSPLPGCQLIKLNWISEVLGDVPTEELLTHQDPLVRAVGAERIGNG